MSGAPYAIGKDLGQTAGGRGSGRPAVFNIFIRFAYSHVFQARIRDKSMVRLSIAVCLLKLIPSTVEDRSLISSADVDGNSSC